MRQFGLKNVFSRLWQDDNQADYNNYGFDKRILIVDDSPTAVYAIRKILRSSRYTTLEASDGLSAVELAKTEQPDLILMDIVMPGMNGFEATRILTKEPATNHIPIIIISGTDQPSDRIWGTKLGAKGFLAKPVNKKELLNLINLVFTSQDLNAAVTDANEEIASP